MSSVAFAQMSSEAAVGSKAEREALPILSVSIHKDQVGPTDEQARGFEQAMPARLDLMSRVASKFASQAAADREYGSERFKHFMLQAHAAPSAVLEALLAKAATMEQFGEGLSAAETSAGAKSLGGDRNLIFFPFGPCRIADSRFSNLGKLTTNVARGYLNWAAAGQGGSSGCNQGSGGIFSGSKGAIAMTVTVTGVDGPGFLTLRPVGSTALTSVINLTPGQDLANSTVVRMTGAGSGNDFEIVPGVFGGAGQVHVILDVLGFYVAAEPTPLQCESVLATSVTSNTTGFKFVSAPTCAVGYTRTGILCSQSANDGTALMSVGFGETDCEWRQSGTNSITYNARSRCCRVPGQTSAFIP